MNVTIQIGTGASPLQGLPDDTFSLRSYALDDYITANGEAVLAGDRKRNYRETTGGTLDATTKLPTYPNLLLPATTDAGNDQTSSWTTIIVDSGGTERDVLFESYEITHALGASITLLQLTIHNEGTTPRRDTTTLTRSQIEALIASAVSGSGAPKATDLIAGIARLSDPAASSADPIVEGSNSARLTALSAATHLNTASAIVKRDASGNFDGGTFTGSVTGAASLNVLKAGDTMTGPLIAPVHDLGGGVYNVRAYGATGDGTTDDTAAINAAIAAAEAAGGGKVFFPEGQYHVEGSGAQIFLVTKAITLEGVGANSRIIVDSAVPTTRSVFTISPAIDLSANFWETQNLFHTIRGLNIYPESGTPAKYGILFDTQVADQYLSRALVEECMISNMGSGYCIASLNAASPENNGTAGLTIRRCQFRGGIYMRPIGDHFHFENNSIGGVEPVDIEQYSGASGMLIAGNVIVNDKGFVVRTAHHPVVRDNYFETPAASGSIQYFVDFEGTTTSHIIAPTFAGNTVSILGGTVDAVRFNYCDKATFGEGNVISQSSGARAHLLVTSNAADTIIKNFWTEDPVVGAGITNGGVRTLFEKLVHGTIPTIAAGAGAGTGPTIAISGSDHDMLITITTGTVPTAAGSVVTVTFLTAFPVAPKVAVTPANAAAAALSGTSQVYVPSGAVSTTAFNIVAGSVALAASTQYIWWAKAQS